MGFKLDVGDFVEDFGLPGLAVGLGAVVLAPLFGPALGKAGKPVAKAAVKAGIVFYEKSRSVLAEAREAFEDIVAESKAELAEAETQQVLTVESNADSG